MVCLMIMISASIGCVDKNMDVNKKYIQVQNNVVYGDYRYHGRTDDDSLFVLFFILKSSSENLVVDSFASLTYKENGENTFELRMIMVTDYEKRISYTYSPFKELLSIDNEMDNINRHDAGKKYQDMFIEGRETGPFLGTRYFSKLNRVNETIFKGEEIKVRDGFTTTLSIRDPIDVVIDISGSGIKERYSDKYGKMVIRWIDPMPMEDLDLSDLDKMISLGNAKLADLIPEIASAMKRDE